MPTLQTMSELRGSIAVKKYIDARIEEESSTVGLIDLSIGAPLHISELAILLDGEGRNGRFLGKGWGLEGPAFSASDSAEIAIAMTELASSKTDIHATLQVFTVRKSVSLYAGMNRRFRRKLRKIQKQAMVEVVEYYESVLTIRYRDKTLTVHRCHSASQRRMSTRPGSGDLRVLHLSHAQEPRQSSRFPDQLSISKQLP